MRRLHILCTGDLHIGRRATRLPDDADSHAASGRKIWLDVVDVALDRNVDLVLLTGDVVDRANRYFEAIGPLEQGLQRLADRGIPVVAIAGNHDFDVLPKLAASFPPEQFRLLGSGGKWERYMLSAGGELRLCIDGWSFPDRHIFTDPLDAYNLGPPPPGVPVIGLLHGDLEQAQSRYAPIAKEALLRHPHLWLLGHWHVPVPYAEDGRLRFLYPGSPLAMNPKEPGCHGPWLLQIGAGGSVTATQVPLSATRYEPLTVDVTGADTLDAIDRRISRAASEKLAAVVAEHGEALRYLLLRLEVVGRTAVHRQLAHHLREGLGDLQAGIGQAVVAIEHWQVATQPARDLAKLAEGTGPPAVLAQMLLELRNENSPARRELLAAAQREVQSVAAQRDYAALAALDAAAGGAGDSGAGAGLPSDDDLVQTLEQQGLLLLDELLAQREVGS